MNRGDSLDLYGTRRAEVEVECPAFTATNMDGEPVAVTRVKFAVFVTDSGRVLETVWGFSRRSYGKSGDAVHLVNVSNPLIPYPPIWFAMFYRSQVGKPALYTTVDVRHARRIV